MPHKSQRSVVITGASSGIGRAAALAFAGCGWNVVLAARRAQALEEVAEHCRQLGGDALAVPTDVTSPEAVEALAQQATARFGGIDVWVNNAAVSLFARLDEAPPEAFHQVIETNLLGTAHGSRAAIARFRDRGRGVLINVSSLVAHIGQPYTSAYVASKFAIRGLGECLRQELADVPEIHVCTILPPSVDTPIFQQAANYTGRTVHPLRPVHDPESVAAAIVRAADRPRREVVIDLPGRLLPLLKVLAPGAPERAAGRKVAREHLGPPPAPHSAGNLFAPLPQFASTRGSRPPLPTRRSGGLVAASLAVAALSAAALATRRRAR